MIGVRIGSMRTFQDVIAAFGGLSAFAHAMSLNQSTASEMKRRNSIPPEHWGHLIAVASERGITLTFANLARMAELRAAERKRRKAA
jgi:hypothetical protein